LTAVFNLTVSITDVNDNKPTFERSYYFMTVQDNLLLHFEITQMLAIDRDYDALIEYSIRAKDKFYIASDVVASIRTTRSISKQRNSSSWN
jgi:hypothetical protein